MTTLNSFLWQWQRNFFMQSCLIDRLFITPNALWQAILLFAVYTYNGSKKNFFTLFYHSVHKLWALEFIKIIIKIILFLIFPYTYSLISAYLWEFYFLLLLTNFDVVVVVVVGIGYNNTKEDGKNYVVLLLVIFLNALLYV